MLSYYVKARKSPINGEVKYYAQSVPAHPVTLNEIADNISAQCTVTIHDVKAVLSALEEQIYSALRDGNSVRLGDVGSFHVTLKSKGTPTAKEFTSAEITNVRVHFYRSSKMAHELSITNPKLRLYMAAPPVSSTTPGPGLSDGGGGSSELSPETGKGGAEI